jgi:hypothetical protein
MTHKENEVSIKDSVSNAFAEKLSKVKGFIKSAEECLKNEVYLQCAVRLQELKTWGNFTELENEYF